MDFSRIVLITIFTAIFATSSAAKGKPEQSSNKGNLESSSGEIDKKQKSEKPEQKSEKSKNKTEKNSSENTPTNKENSNKAGGNNKEAQDANEPNNSKSRGRFARSLKNLNAAHANATAFLNASEKSNVGKISIYKKAVEQTLLLSKEVEEQQKLLDETSKNLDDFFTATKTINSVEDLNAKKNSLIKSYEQLLLVPTDELTNEQNIELTSLENEIFEFNLILDLYNQVATEYNNTLLEYEKSQSDLAAASLNENNILNDELDGSQLTDEEVAALKELLDL